MSRGHSFYLAQLEKRIFSDIIEPLRALDDGLALSSVSLSKLGEVRDFGVLVEEAQRQGVPLERVKGGNSTMKQSAAAVFLQVAEKIIERMPAFRPSS